MVKYFFVTLLTLFVLSGTVEAANRCAPSATPAGGCTASYASVQAAVTAAVAGDFVYLHAGTTYTESITLPNKGVLSSYITITTDAASGSLPAANVRTCGGTKCSGLGMTDYSSFMPKILSPGSGLSAVYTATSANHYKFQHIDFPAVPFGFNTIIQIGAGDSTQQFESQEPTDFIIDQCYLHGDPVAGQHRAVDVHGKNVTITNSFFTQIVDVGQDAQCIGGFNGHGPLDIENNYLECGTENIFYGGADPLIRTYMHITGTPTTTTADVSTYETGHTLAELKVGQLVAVQTSTATPPAVEFSTLTAISSTGATGTLTWSPALTTTPVVGGDIRAGVVLSGLTVRRNFVTKNVAWKIGVLPAPASPSATGSTVSGTLVAGTYCYEVQAFSANGYGHNYVNGPLATEVCATTAATGKVTVAWSAVSGSTIYRVWRGTAVGGENQWAETTATSLVDDGSISYTSATPFGATQWSEKCLFEIKAAQNVQVDSNIFDTSYKGSDIGYSGMWLKSVNQDGNCWYCQSRDIVIEKNIFRHIAGWFLTSAREAYGQPRPPAMTNLTIRNNLVYDSTYTNGGDIYAMSLANGGVNYTIDHNTVVHITDGNGGGLMSLDSGTVFTITNLVIKNNMFRRETYGIHGDAQTEGAASLAAAAPGYSFLNNAVAGANSSIYPASNQYPSYATWEAAFTTYTADGSGGADYHINAGAGGAAFRNAGTDGKDIGADISLINTATTGVATGTGASLSITTATIPNAVRTVAYSQTLAATGGTAPYTWTVTSGTLPAGLSLSTGGVLSGTPTTTATYTFTVTATDNVGATTTATYTIQVFDPVTISTGATLPRATINVAYSQTIVYAGGVAPYSCAVTSGSLPTNITLNSATCVLSGTPTVSATSSFTITVTGSLGSSASRAFSLLVGQEVLPNGRPAATGPIPQEAAMFRRASAPTSADSVLIGDIWLNTSTSPPTMNVAISTTPVTWSLIPPIGNAALLTNLNASQLLTGTIPSSVIPAAFSATTSVTAPNFFGTGASMTGYYEWQETSCSTLSASGKTRLCMDSADHTLKLSQNGGAFGPLGGGGSLTGASLSNSDGTVSFSFSQSDTTDTYGMGASTANGRSATWLSNQGAQWQALRFHDSTATTDYVWGAGVSSNTGGTWVFPWRIRQNGELHVINMIIDSQTAPTCAAGIRGQFNYTAGGAGVKDSVQVCAKDASDVYAWRTIY